MHITLFGSFQVHHQNRLINFARRKSESLLAYLALHPGPQPREKLAGLFWGDSSDEDARRALRVVLTDLRKNLGEEAFTGERDALGLNPAIVAELDAQAFASLLRKPESASNQEIETALALYRGDLLEGMYDEWLLPHREHFSVTWLAAALLLIERQRAEGDYARAIQGSRSLLQREPANEKAHQHLIFCLAASGEREAALQQVEACRAALQRHLGVELSAETLALLSQIQKRAPEASAARLGNLPRPLTSFIGREDELNEVETLLAETRLLTLLGPGGSGKTRLAIQAADEVAFEYPDGVWWVDLAPLSAPDLVAQSIAKSLGVREQPGQSLLDLTAAQVGEQRLLVLLDNCEHLLAASAHCVETLLARCPALVFLNTSREPLGLPGEVGWQVPTLPLPSAGQDLKTIRKNEAVRLFVERARSANSFQLDETNAPLVVEVCARLQGIPLAIELAAAQLNQMELDKVVQTLDLSSAEPNHHSRRATLRATIQWSYDLLTTPQQMLFRRLGVFRGGWGVDSAAVVAGGYPQPEEIVSPGQQGPVSPLPVTGEMITRQVLDNLARKALIQPEYDPDGLRYDMLDTVREFAREKQAESNEAALLREAHYAYFARLAARAQPELNGPRIAEWMRRLVTCRDNLRAGLEWAFGQDTQAGLLLSSALMDYWINAGDFQEGVDWLMAFLAQPGAADPSLARAKALAALGFIYEAQLKNAQAEPYAAEALAIYRALGDPRGEAFALWVLGSALCGHDDYQAGRPLVFESLALYRKLGDALGVAEVLCALGNFVDDENPERARGYMTESLTLSRELGTPAGYATRLANLGRIDCRAGDYASARVHLSEALALYRSMGITNLSFIIEALGELAMREGKYDEASRYFEEAILLARKGGLTNANYWIYSFLGYATLRQANYARARALFIEAQDGFYKAGLKIGVAYTMEGLASLAVAQKQSARAVCLYAWADALRDVVGNARPPVEQADVDRELAQARAALTRSAFEAAQTQGYAMSIEAAVTFARQSG